MINSDNVVRGGLTPKLKDIKTLLEILPYQDMNKRLISGGKVENETPYRVDYTPEKFNELHVIKVDLVKDQTF